MHFQGGRLELQGARLQFQGGKLEFQGARLKLQGARLVIKGASLGRTPPGTAIALTQERCPSTEKTMQAAR